MSLKESFEEQFGSLLEGSLDMFTLTETSQAGQPPSDLEQIHLAQQRLQEFNEEGKKNVDKARNDVRALARQFQQTQLANARTTGAPTSAEHEASMAAAQQALLAGLKTNKQLEQQLYRYQAELARLQQENRDEEDDSVDGTELNSEVLRLKIYRDLGLTPKEEDGIVTQVLVRSQVSHDVRTITLDSGSTSFFWSNYLWDALAA